MEKFLRDLKLDEVQDFFLSGHPNILIQLLAVNTVMMIIYIIRRMHNESYSVRNVTHVLQWILLFSNVVVLFELQWVPLVQQTVSTVMWKYRNFIPYT